MLTKEDIKSLRLSLHLTQAQFAEKVGVARLVVSQWETGYRFPGRDNYLKLLELVKDGGRDKEQEGGCREWK